MLPSVDRDVILGAMTRFDHELRGTHQWTGWEQNRVHKYAIRENTQLYPVKQIVSMATGIPVSEFRGGVGAGQANQYVGERGFNVVPLRSRKP